MSDTVRCMRATKAGAVDVLEAHTYPVDDLKASLASDEVLVRTAFVGINFIDTYHRSGLYPPPRPFPCTLGGEASGTVVAAGDDAFAKNSAIKVGTNVAFFTSLSGTYSSFIKLKAIDAFPVPDGIALDVAAAAMLQGCTAHYLSASCRDMKAGDVCLVHAAAGGTGLLLSQMCKIRGATVIGTCGSDEKKELALKVGKCDQVVNYTATPEWWDEVKKLTDGKGVDVVFDGVGKATFMKGLEVLKKRGDMITFGNASGAVEPIAPLMLMKHGAIRLQRPQLTYFASHEEREIEQRVDELFGWIKAGKLEVVIGKTFDLEKVADAHNYLEGRCSVGKVLLRADAQ